MSWSHTTSTQATLEPPVETTIVPESVPVPQSVTATEDSAAEPGYWKLSRQPLYSLIFLTPLIGLLEGLKWSQASAGESPNIIGVESWVVRLLNDSGFNYPWILPATLVTILFGWHAVGRYQTKIRPVILLGMGAECLMYACLLVVIGQMQDLFFENIVYRSPLSIFEATGVDFRGRLITFVGAGLYEEVLFRLCLLPVIWGCLKLLTVPDRIAAVFAVIFTSFAFAVAHQLTAEADPISSLTLSFRIVAGLFLSVLFIRRGFGVTAGCHSVYDVLVGVIMRSRN